MKSKNNSRLLTLDAMRGLAAIAVIFYHLEFVAPFAPSGYLAVDFFFLMSGIVIAKAYASRLSDGLSLMSFAIERSIRLFPIYLVGMIVGIVRRCGQIYTNHPEQLTWAKLGISAAFNMLMLPSPVTHDISPINGPAWSLFFELFVNLLWAGVLVKLTKKVLIVYVAAMGVALVLSIFAKGSVHYGFTWSEFHIGVLRSFFGFGLGVLMAQHFSNDKLRNSKASVFATLGLCVLLISDAPNGYRVIYDIVAIFILFPIIARLACVFNPPKIFHKTAGVLGDISYPIYALHYGPVFTAAFVARKLDVAPSLWIPVFIVGLFLISIYLARTYDPRARTIMKSMVTRSSLRTV